MAKEDIVEMHGQLLGLRVAIVSVVTRLLNESKHPHGEMSVLYAVAQSDLDHSDIGVAGQGADVVRDQAQQVINSIFNYGRWGH